MPARHSPPPVVEEPTTEKLKRPKKNGTVTKEARDIQSLLFEDTESLARPPGPSKIDNPATLAGTRVDSPSTEGTEESTLASASGEEPPPAPLDEARARPGIFTVGGIDFHHESEAEFARLLSYYGIEWLYEPHQFPLQWREGRPIEMFSPDFYLVEYDFYIELTTMRQALVRKKNRKLRLLRALYPEINIKLLYRRDYERLLSRFSIGPADTDAANPPGQETPDADEPANSEGL